ncbi:MAG: phage head closure protein [Methanobrevibacter sp.]|jgi:SPP1 family predicted phage head-tail adaptor|nr:phage head closure protein [Methanobrevibacter sp.]
MWAGLRNESIDIMRYTSAPNAFGEVVKTLVKEYSTRAKVVHLSGSRIVRNDEIQYPYNKTFVLRYNSPITEDNLIKWQGKLWRVQSIDNDRAMMQTVVVTEIVNE